jgi:hypothetical protein
MRGPEVTKSIQRISARRYPEGKTTSNNFVGIVEVLSHNSALMGFNNAAT